MNTNAYIFLEAAQANLDAALAVLDTRDLSTPAAREKLTGIQASLRALDPEYFAVPLDVADFDDFPFDLPEEMHNV